MGAIAALAAVLLVASFIMFANGLPRDSAELADPAEGIVVLTGGASRIVDGVELLAAKRGQRLLISGVHPSTTRTELIRMNPQLADLLGCCIDLGHDAVNTIGNAVETAHWVHEHGFRSLIVVTSSWHMPRALVELGRELPTVELVPYPVVSKHMREQSWWSDAQTTRLLLVEYVKYLASSARAWLDPVRTRNATGGVRS